MPTIKKGGIDYRIDELVALLEEKIQNGDESDDEMSLYMDYKQFGDSAFKQKDYRHVVIHLISEVDA